MTSFPIVPLSTARDVVQAVNRLDKTSLNIKTHDILTDYIPSPIDLAHKTCEALYADAISKASTTSDDARVLCHQCALYCMDAGYGDLAHTSRGVRISREMRRQLGDPSVTSTVADRPPALWEYDLDPPPPIVPPVVAKT